MSLKSLTFTTLPSSSRNPIEIRRVKTIARLEDQKLLLQDPAYKRSVQRWVKINGQKSLLEKQQRVFPWWRTAADGSTVLFIRVGGRPIEFEKGKAGISVGARNQLLTTIDALISAVNAGELDSQLAQTFKRRSNPKTDKA
ncbi:MAG: hypothetical protein KIT85_07395 [Pseudolabrys sp.]|nr:hypothetical protein [Pseudolabrys sp.]